MARTKGHTVVCPISYRGITGLAHEDETFSCPVHGDELISPEKKAEAFEERK